MAKGKYEYWLSPDGLLLLEAWARDGLTDEQIANNLGIRRETLYAWKKSYPSIDEALRRGKAVIDTVVENALLNKAMGLKEKVKKPMKLKETVFKEGKKVSEREHVEYVDEEVFVPPDTTAQIFWLKNRKPKEWNGQGRVEITPVNSNRPSEPHQAVWEILSQVSEKVASGELDNKRAGVIITSCKAILGSIRVDEQQKQIEELAELLDNLVNEKERNYEKD